MKGVSSPYFDPEFDTLIERISPPGVVIDNETCEDCTLVKVDSANRHGILLEMVQVLTDLDLVISKSYISSDGGWLMDVFHVTDQLGNQLTDGSLIQFIRQSLVAGRGGGSPWKVCTCLGKLVGPAREEASESTVVEVTATDRLGLLSEIAAVLAVLGCHVTSVQAWTHNSRAAVILYVTDHATGEPITDPVSLAEIEEQVDNVVEARVSMPGERWRVSVSGPTPGRIHTERRMHQMMREDRDYETGPAPPPAEADQFAVAHLEAKRRINDARGGAPSGSGIETKVLVDSWKERGYSVVNIRSRDRPKLLFDTVCALTDMQYVVFHASVSSHGPLALQEYYIRNKAGCALDEDGEKQRVTQCLVAAVERRVSHGLRLDLCTRNRAGLLADVTRILRENGLSLARAECSTRGERAQGTFYVTDISGAAVDPKAVEFAREEIGGDGVLEVSKDVTPGWLQVKRRNSRPSIVIGAGSSSSSSSMEHDRPRFSLGSLLWSQIGKFSSNSGSIRW